MPLALEAGHAFRGCHVHNSAAWTVLSDGLFHTVTWDTNDFDTDTMHSVSVNTNRITIQTAGYYQFCGSIGFTANGAGGRFITCRNSAGTAVSQGGAGSVTAQDTDLGFEPVIVLCAVADWFDVGVVVAAAAGTVTIDNRAGISWFQAQWLGF